MSNSQQTTDHQKIRRWAEARNGKPVRVQGTGSGEFFEKFYKKRLAFVYQEKTASGEPSRFNRFVNR